VIVNFPLLKQNLGDRRLKVDKRARREELCDASAENRGDKRDSFPQ